MTCEWIYTLQADSAFSDTDPYIQNHLPRIFESAERATERSGQYHGR